MVYNNYVLTNIVIKKTTRSKLRYFDRKEQTYDDIINELLEIVKKGSVDLAELTEPEKL